jgi:hypothetical protein
MWLEQFSRHFFLAQGLGRQIPFKEEWGLADAFSFAAKLKAEVIEVFGVEPHVVVDRELRVIVIYPNWDFCHEVMAAYDYN